MRRWNSGPRWSMVGRAMARKMRSGTFAWALESEEIENHDGSLDLLYREMQCDITYPVTFLRYTLLIMKPCLPRLKHWVPD